MEISETKERAINLSHAAFKETESSIRFTKGNLEGLNMGNEEKEQQQDGNVLPEIDPTRYLDEREKRQWNRLSDKRKQKYFPMKKGSGSGRIQGSKSNDNFGMYGLDAQGNFGTKGGKFSVPSVADSAAKSSGKISAEVTTGGAIGAEAAAAGASAGASAAAQIGKKTAENFRKTLQSRAVESEQAVGNLQGKFERIREENRARKNGKQTVAFAGATVMLALLSMFQAASTMLLPFVATIAAAIATIAVIASVIGALSAVILSAVSLSGTSSAERLVEIALTQEGNTDGTKYWEYTMGTRFVNGSATPWCACFVSWCANECDLIDEGIFPKSGSVAAYKSYYQQKGLYEDAGSYTPKTGDLIIFNPSHIGIVQFVEGERVVTIEGNTSDAVHSRSYPLDSSYIVGYCKPEYPGSSAIVIPEGMGTHHTYMGWHKITNRTSLQYQLREDSGENYNEEGFAMIDGRYVIACTSTFGSVGDYVDFYREDGSVIHAVIGDIKNPDDPGCNAYGHENGKCVVEYVVDRSWYPSHANPGTANCHPEWRSRVEKAVNLGVNYFD